MTDLSRVGRAGPWLGICLTVFAGCGPRPPKVVLDAPGGMPRDLAGRQLFHTPQAYIYARSDLAAGEVDRMVKDVATYIEREHDRELGKGLVIVMDPQDAPIAATLEAQFLLETDPSIMVTRPSHPKTVKEVRQRLRDEGIPEGPSVRGTSLPIPEAKLGDLGVVSVGSSWAVAVPSKDLAEECGIEVAVGALRKKRPDISEDRARRATASLSGTMAKPFEINRSIPIFVYWAQSQSDWSDRQRRDAIRGFIKHVFRSNWLPVPSDEELQW